MKKFLVAVLFTAFIGVGFAVEIRSDFLYSLVLRVIAEGEISPDEMVTILTACEKNNKKVGKQCGEVLDQLVETEVKGEEKTAEETAQKMREEVKEEVMEEVKAEVKEDVKEEIKEQVKAELKAEEEEKKRLEEEAEQKRQEEEAKARQEAYEKCMANLKKNSYTPTYKNQSRWSLLPNNPCLFMQA